MRRGDREARTTEDVAIPKLYEQLHIIHMYMELLPSVGWADVATKHDLTYMRTDMHREFEIMRADMHREFEKVRLEFRADISEALLRQTRWFFTMLITVNTATVGLVFAAMKLL